MVMVLWWLQQLPAVVLVVVPAGLDGGAALGLDDLHAQLLQGLSQTRLHAWTTHRQRERGQ